MRRSKYNNIKVTFYGHKFDSKKEGQRYLELRQMEIDGHISNLELQPSYKMEINGVKICTYKADFKYNCAEYGDIVEDVKGFKTAIYKLKKKLMKAIHNIEIKET